MNRHGLLLAFGLASIVTLPGCALLDGGEAEKSRIVAETKAEIDAKTREVETEKQRVALELAKAQRDSNRQIAELKNATDAQIQAIADELSDKGLSREQALAAFIANRQAKVDELNRAAADRIAAIERQNAAFASVVGILGPAAQGAANSIPGGGLVLAAITAGLGAFGIGRSTGKAKGEAIGWKDREEHQKAIDATWDDAQKSDQLAKVLSAFMAPKSADLFEVAK
jgi:hypothetical protein